MYVQLCRMSLSAGSRWLTFLSTTISLSHFPLTGVNATFTPTCAPLRRAVCSVSANTTPLARTAASARRTFAPGLGGQAPTCLSPTDPLMHVSSCTELVLCTMPACLNEHHLEGSSLQDASIWSQCTGLQDRMVWFYNGDEHLKVSPCAEEWIAARWMEGELDDYL